MGESDYIESLVNWYFLDSDRRNLCYDRTRSNINFKKEKERDTINLKRKEID